MKNHERFRGVAALTLASSLSIFALIGCASTEQTTTSAADEPAAMSDAALEAVAIRPGDVVRLSVWGMSCPKCVNNVDQVLTGVSGVTRTTTDMANGVVTVETGWPAPRPADLKAAVDQAGFTLMNITVAGAQGVRGAAILTVIVAGAACSIAAPARAQQTTITPAATQPGKGVIVQRTLMQATAWDVASDEFSFSNVSELRTDLSFAYGLAGDWSLLATVPIVHRDFDGPAGLSGSDPTGIGDPTLEIRHRFVNDPLGPVDTRRIAWFAGVEAPLGRDAFSSNSVDPYVGLALTQITGRLGLGAGLSYKATTGASDRPLHPGDTTADLVRLTGSAAWRLHPKAWGSELAAAYYFTLEAEAIYETSGESMFRLAPGFLIEAPSYAIEVAVLLPVAEEADRRPEHDLAVIAGLRVFF